MSITRRTLLVAATALLAAWAVPAHADDDDYDDDRDDDRDDDEDDDREDDRDDEDDDDDLDHDVPDDEDDDDPATPTQRPTDDHEDIPTGQIRQTVNSDGLLTLEQMLTIFQGYGTLTVVDVVLRRTPARTYYRFKYIDGTGTVRTADFDAVTGQPVR
ncbi:PepSY domain-containing protein [Pelagibacterium luteolum]|uniref:Peptidase propeptide and YPEB domain-containing protein n=1 Tax=Pelagibacterium luteolum TaxID=440168 RepID=A0A1G7S264_9HYPH|nr:PepSY domain-containing protein [Pelagibacterium luteolum]SDG16539.1 hypothetical protein SAMN04487974_101235 [Pelagibacterium luteolum]